MERAGSAEPCDFGWFAARQPGIVRFLELRLHDSEDARAVALDAAWTMCRALERRDGVPPARVERSLLDRAMRAVEREARAYGPVTDGFADRLPDTCRYIESIVIDPPLPLGRGERLVVATALSAIAYALDELTTGRLVP